VASVDLANILRTADRGLAAARGPPKAQNQKNGRIEGKGSPIKSPNQ